MDGSGAIDTAITADPMFTGIIEKVGRIVRSEPRAGGRIIRVEFHPRGWEDLADGESVCVNGVCLTVTDGSGGGATFDAVPETVRRTTLGLLRPGDPVNLERSLQVGGRLGGHYVLGHVDTVGTIRRRTMEGLEIVLEVDVGPGGAGQIIPQGSIAVDGVSLTVASLGPAAFTVAIVPYTAEKTNLTSRKPMDPVNIEYDHFGKWVGKILEARIGAADPQRMRDILDRAGFTGGGGS